MTEVQLLIAALQKTCTTGRRGSAFLIPMRAAAFCAPSRNSRSNGRTCRFFSSARSHGLLWRYARTSALLRWGRLDRSASRLPLRSRSRYK